MTPIEPRRFFGKFAGRLYPFDHMTMLYCWLIIIHTINFARPLSDFLDIILFHGGVILFVILFSWYCHDIKNRWVRFIRLMYPGLLMTSFYTMSGRLVLSLWPEFFDAQVTAFEKLIMGVNLTLWLDGHLNLFLTELFSAGYFSYYFLIPGLTLTLFFTKRDRELRRFMTATCGTFFVSYLIFILYPITGPRFYFEGHYATEITGLIFRPMVDYVIQGAAFRGGAMPSSHVAEALVVLLFALKYYGKKVGWLIPVVVILAMGTVYGRFHYLIDVIVGTLIGAGAYLITIRFNRSEEDAEPVAHSDDKNPEKNYVPGHY